METARMETAMETHFMAKMGKVRNKDKKQTGKRERRCHQSSSQKINKYLLGFWIGGINLDYGCMHIYYPGNP